MHSNAISVSHQLSTHILSVADPLRRADWPFILAARVGLKAYAAAATPDWLLLHPPSPSTHQKTSNGDLTCGAWRRVEAGGGRRKTDP